MKTNLGNFLTEPAFIRYGTTYQKWRNDFEAELRPKLASTSRYNKLILEILNEEPEYER